jgi:uncharacterized protein involved in exopolysaccharide biosynthesis
VQLGTRDSRADTHVTESPIGSGSMNRDDEAITIFAIATVLLHWRRTIVITGILGMGAGLAAGLLTKRVYVSAATFLPQAVEGGATSGGLAAAASQFGLRLPTSSGSGWSPAVYAQVVRSRAVLDSIALDTVVMAENGGRRVAVMDLLDVKPATREAQVASAAQALAKMVDSREVKTLNAVEVTVTTPWPDVSLELAERLVQGVNRFNLQARKSQAAAERQFVEARTAEADTALRNVEDRLQQFNQQNRAGVSGSPGLQSEKDRLQRNVDLRQQLYTSLLQNLAEVRIREIRDTPVITILDAPRLPLRSEGRGTLIKGIAGGILGAGLAAFAAFLFETIAGVRLRSTDDAREFFALLDRAMPSVLRRNRR